MNLQVLALTGALAACSAQASETMRCGKWLVDAQASREELSAKCGEPDRKEIKTEEVRRHNKFGTGSQVVGTTNVERWIYHRGSRSFEMIVTIVDGKIKSIDKAE